MTRSARRLLRIGLFFFIVGALLAFGGFALYYGTLATTITDGINSTTFDQPDIDTERLIAGLIIMGVGAIMNVVGILMMLVAAVMRREQVREPNRRR